MSVVCELSWVETRCWTEPDARVEQNRSFYPLSTSFDDNIICLRISSLIPHNLLLKSLLWEKNSKQSNFLPVPNWEGTMSSRVWTAANPIQCKYFQPAATLHVSKNFLSIYKRISRTVSCKDFFFPILFSGEYDDIFACTHFMFCIFPCSRSDK